MVSPAYFAITSYCPPGKFLKLLATVPPSSASSPTPVLTGGVAVVTRPTWPEGVPPLPFTPMLMVTGVPCVKLVGLRLSVVVVGVNCTEVQYLRSRAASTLPRPVA